MNGIRHVFRGDSALMLLFCFSFCAMAKGVVDATPVVGVSAVFLVMVVLLLLRWSSLWNVGIVEEEKDDDDGDNGCATDILIFFGVGSGCLLVLGFVFVPARDGSTLKKATGLFRVRSSVLLSASGGGLGVRPRKSMGDTFFGVLGSLSERNSSSSSSLSSLSPFLALFAGGDDGGNDGEGSDVPRSAGAREKSCLRAFVAVMGVGTGNGKGSSLFLFFWGVK